VYTSPKKLSCNRSFFVGGTEPELDADDDEAAAGAESDMTAVTAVTRGVYTV
jgi:hypothetical protein